MTTEFYKYHGTGNDFIIIDNRQENFTLKPSIIASLCNRHFGIGADGLVLINRSESSSFSMRYFNSDGFEGSLCGNGGRCLVALANYLGICGKDVFFEAVDGMHHATILEHDGMITTVKLSMKNVTHLKSAGDCFFLDTGSPHYVLFVDDLKSTDIVKEGRAIRNSNKFRSQGVNVNFAEMTIDGLFVRTYERGVEDETLSCGTGVVASAIAHSLLSPGKNEVFVKTLGGILQVSFKRNEKIFSDIWLTGPATFVYKGIINI